MKFGKGKWGKKTKKLVLSELTQVHLHYVDSFVSKMLVIKRNLFEQASNEPRLALYNFQDHSWLNGIMLKIINDLNFLFRSIKLLSNRS